MNTNDNAPLITAAGGLILFISLFLSWGFDASAWEAFSLTDVVLAAFALIALAAGGSIAAGNPLAIPAGALTTGGLVALGMVAITLFETDDRDFGLFVAVVGVITIIVGALGLANAGSGSAPRTTTAPPPPPPPPTA